MVSLTHGKLLIFVNYYPDPDDHHRMSTWIWKNNYEAIEYGD
jgi:hypothetical protein